MSVEETNNKAKVRELISIAITPFPDWEGETITVEKRFGDKLHKFSIIVPVPLTDEEAEETYSIDMAKIRKAGVSQLWYGARDVDNVITEALEKGRDPNSQTVLDLVTIAAADQKFTARERVSQAKETKVLASEVKGANMTIPEAIIAMKQLAALKARGIDISTL